MKKEELEQYEIFYKEKTNNFYKNKFNNEKNLDNIMEEELYDLFIRTAVLFIHANAIIDSLEKYKRSHKQKFIKNIIMYTTKMKKLLAILNYAIQTYEEIYKELGKIPEWV